MKEQIQSPFASMLFNTTLQPLSSFLSDDVTATELFGVPVTNIGAMQAKIVTSLMT